MDRWGVGSYEDTAAELEPMADVAVGALGLTGGERVLDVACGTGNAAAVAAAAGARVVGLDSSERLVQVARERVPGAEFVVGDATEMPFADGEFDAAVSVVGVIFASPAERAVAEIARVVRPGGLVAVTCWVPEGPGFDAIRLMREAIARVRPPEGPPPVEWSDRAVLDRLFGGYGTLDVTRHRMPVSDDSPEERWDRWEASHPMWIGARRLLEPAGEWDRLRTESIAALRAGGGGDLYSDYLIVLLTRG
jgi:SAM-dependent methyltransferase